MVLRRSYRGRVFDLVVVRAGDRFRFKLGDRCFNSLTAAAEYVLCKQRGVSGPEFWDAPKEAIEDFA